MSDLDQLPTIKMCYVRWRVAYCMYVSDFHYVGVGLAPTRIGRIPLIAGWGNRVTTSLPLHRIAFLQFANCGHAPTPS